MKGFRRIKSELSFMIVFSLILSLLAPVFTFGAEQVQLKDVEESYAKTEIQALIDKGVVSGFEDGFFHPGKEMTRGELAKILVLAIGLKEKPESASAFVDVGADSWYRGYIGALVEAKIAQGTSETTFSPTGQVTREELAAFFIRAFGLDEQAVKITSDAPFSDWSDVSAWARGYVALAYKIGFVGGIQGEGGTLEFSPKEKAERQALARLAYEFITNKSKYADKAREIAGTPAPSPTPSNTPAPSPSPSNIPAPVSGGGGGKSSRNSSSTQDPVKAALESGSYQAGNYEVNSSGTYGNGTNITTVDNLTVGTKNDIHVTLQNISVNQKLTLDPGAAGEVTLDQVRADEIVVLSGAPSTIKLKGVIVVKLTINSQDHLTRIETLEGTNILETSVRSQVILESTGGYLGDIKVNQGAAGKEVELRGSILTTVSVEAENAKIKLRPRQDGTATEVAEIKTLTKVEIDSAANTSLTAVNVDAPNVTVSVKGEGRVEELQVSANASDAVVDLQSDNVANVKLNGKAELKGSDSGIRAASIQLAEGADVTVADTIRDVLKAKALEKYNEAIGQLDFSAEYSNAFEKKVLLALGIANAAQIFGANQSELNNFDALLEKAANLILVRAQLEAAKEHLAVGFSADDSKESVRSNVYLPLQDDTFDRVSISWQSGNENVLRVDSGTTGYVTRPAVGNPDAVVPLKATLSYQGLTAVKDFTLIVKANTQGYEWLNFGTKFQFKFNPQDKTDFLGIQPGKITLQVRNAELAAAFAAQQLSAASGVPGYSFALWREDGKSFDVSDLQITAAGQDILEFTFSFNPTEIIQPGLYVALQITANGQTSLTKKLQLGRSSVITNVEDRDENGGLDGRDFTIRWIPSKWTNVVERRIYLLPLGVQLNEAKHKPVAVLKDLTQTEWTGDASLAVDSTGYRLTGNKYSILVSDVDKYGKRVDSNNYKLFAPVSDFSIVKNSGYSWTDYLDGYSKLTLGDVAFRDPVEVGQVEEGLANVTVTGQTYKIAVYGSDGRLIKLQSIEPSSTDPLTVRIVPQDSPRIKQGQYVQTRLYKGDQIVHTGTVVIGNSPIFKVEDRDVHSGVDGRDFSVAWKQSTWQDVTDYRVYILPRGTTLNFKTHVPVHEVRRTDDASYTWQGTSDLKADSSGNPLASTDYDVSVMALASPDYAESGSVTRYYYRIIPFRPSADLSPVPASVTNLTYDSLTPTGLNLHWTAPADIGQGTVTYLVYRDNIKLATVTDTTYAVNGLSTGMYTFKVYTTYDGSSLSAPASIQVVTPLAAIGNVYTAADQDVSINAKKLYPISGVYHIAADDTNPYLAVKFSWPISSSVTGAVYSGNINPFGQTVTQSTYFVVQFNAANLTHGGSYQLNVGGLSATSPTSGITYPIEPFVIRFYKD